MGTSWWRLNEKKQLVLVGDVEDMLAWGNQEDFWRRVAETQVAEFRVSTVFLGLDHSWGPDLPLVFETMVFDLHGNPLWDLEVKRYSSWEAAERGHDWMVALVRERKWRWRIERWQRRISAIWTRFGEFWGRT